MTSKGLEWKKIENFSNYSVSSMGEVRNDKTNKILKQSHNNKGYMYCYIKRDDGVYKNCQVHRLVAKTFIPNINDKPCVNHKDYNPSNNNVENLEWVTHSENCLHSIEHIKNARTYKNHSKRIRQKISICTTNFNRDLGHHIYHNRNHFMFVITQDKKRHSKTFKTLDEAISYRDKYLKEIGYESRGLEALEEIKSYPIEQHIKEGWDISLYEEQKEQCDIIEKELKALEIIKNKKVNLFHIWVFDDYTQYKEHYPFSEYSAEEDMLTFEEFELLKEVIGDES